VIADDDWCCLNEWDGLCQEAFDEISDACADMGCPPGEMADCNGNCFPISWLGDGECDSGQWSYNGNPIVLNCEELNWDNGDCDPSGACSVTPPACVLSDMTAYAIVIAD